jgi:hypothetical protein
MGVDCLSRMLITLYLYRLWNAWAQSPVGKALVGSSQDLDFKFRKAVSQKRSEIGLQLPTTIQGRKLITADLVLSSKLRALVPSVAATAKRLPLGSTLI